GGVPTPPFFCIQSTGNDDPAPWPYRSTIKARFLDDVPEVVRRIFVSTLEGWFASQPTRELKVEWVKNGGDAHIRFGITTNEATHCALGRLVPTNQQEPTSLLALRAWKTRESEVVWSHSDIERMARHVWGHVLGLPHAYVGAEFQWKDEHVARVCDAVGLKKSQVTALSGSWNLDFPDSIMHCDRPSHLASTPAIYKDPAGIDKNTAEFLNHLYPSPKDMELLHVYCKDMPGFESTWTDQRVHTKKQPTKFANGQRISCLNYIELGTAGNFQAIASSTASAGDDKNFGIRMGAWDPSVHIHNVGASFLNFNPTVKGIQSGSLEFGIESGTSASPVKQLQRWIDFKTPYKSPPKVTAFIYGFSIKRGDWIRMQATPSSITNTGFIFCVETWGTTRAYAIGAHWLAHAADDPSIRSGRFAPAGDASNWVTKNSGTISFSPPFVAKPQCIFVGFDHANV
ncbi:hypothetical protein B0H67DRAFT_464038, partial [Lasiosphaeris hirsuta]